MDWELVSLYTSQLIDVTYYFIAAIQLCVIAHGRAGNRGEGQVCQEPAYHQTLLGKAFDASTETPGKTRHRVNMCSRPQYH